MKIEKSSKSPATPPLRQPVAKIASPQTNSPAPASTADPAEVDTWRRVESYLAVESEDFVRSALVFINKTKGPLRATLLNKLEGRPSKLDAPPDVRLRFDELVRECRLLVKMEVSRLTAADGPPST